MGPTLWERLGRGRAEILLTLLAVGWLASLGRVLGDAELFRGWDDRYLRDIQLEVKVLPEAGKADWARQVCSRFYEYLPAGDLGVCAEYRKPKGWSGVRQKVKDALARQDQQEPPPQPAKPMTAESWDQARQLLGSMETAHAAWAKSFFAPLASTQKQREAWEAEASEGFVEDDWRDRFNNLMEETQAYREAYQLKFRRDSALSQPVECAWSFLSRQINANPPTANALSALLGLAVVLDGRSSQLPGGAFPSNVGWNQEETQKMGCKDTPSEMAEDAANLLSKARTSAGNAAKAEAVRGLLPKARWQFVAWALAGLLALHLGRRAVLPNRLLFAALLVWSVVAAMTRPQLQWLGGGDVGWLGGGWKPAVWLFIAACSALFLPWKQPVPAAVPASALGYPGFVLFTGLSGWLLLDLSANGYFDNRFQGLYQQGNVFAAFVLVSVLPVLRIPLARLGLSVLGFWPLVAAGRNLRAAISWGLAFLGILGLLLALAVLLKAHRQLTSEIFRLSLLLGLSWFLLARADKLVSPWLGAQGWTCAGSSNLAGPALHPRLKALGSRLACEAVRLKLATPLLLLLVFVMGGLKLTDDNGPLLVVLYFGSLFLGLGITALVAQKVHWRLGMALGMLAVPLYVWVGSFALLHYGGRVAKRISERLESAQTPFTASNDQMAFVLWFQDAAADSGGFGLGRVPWCGELAGVCRGVPAQIQSDYMYTALDGVFGPWVSALLLAVFAFWLWRLARYHLAGTSGRVETDDLGQAWLSWMALCWAGLTLTQLAITVAGNRAWLPLTGITFPFLSYGTWSLLGNAWFLGLALNVNRRKP